MQTKSVWSWAQTADVVREGLARGQRDADDRPTAIIATAAILLSGPAPFRVAELSECAVNELCKYAFAVFLASPLPLSRLLLCFCCSALISKCQALLFFFSFFCLQHERLARRFCARMRLAVCAKGLAKSPCKPRVLTHYASK